MELETVLSIIGYLKQALEIYKDLKNISMERIEFTSSSIVYRSYASITKHLLYGDKYYREWGNKRKWTEGEDMKRAKKFQTIEIRINSPSEIATHLVSFFDKYETITQKQLIEKLTLLCETWQDRAKLKLQVKPDQNLFELPKCIIDPISEPYIWDYFKLVYSIRKK